MTSGPSRSATIIGTLLTALLAGTLGACGATERDTSQVQMLWYGAASDGRATYGVTPVDVVARDSDRGQSFAVDMSGAGKAGDQWQTAAWTAATVGTMLANADPRGLTISYRLAQSIDGPSAGAVLTTAVLADLTEAAELSKQVTMTGTVLPSGAIGPVAGIPAKVRAAAEAGIATVLIPAGQSIAVDPVTGQRVSVPELGEELGIEVVTVASVQQAFAYFSPQGASPTVSTSAAPDTPVALQPALASLFTDATTAALLRLAPLLVPDSPTSSLDDDRRRIAAGIELARTRVPALLAEGRAVDAFARVTLAERELLAWNAEVQAFTEATADQPGTVTRLADQADDLAQAADVAITAAGDTPVTFLEQASAMPDALSWGTDAWANAMVIADGLRAGAATTPREVAAVAGLLAAARYDLDTYLPFSVRAARSVGMTAIVEPGTTAQILSSYAELLADTGEAGLADAGRGQALGTTAAKVFDDPLAWEFAVLARLAERWSTAGDGQLPAGTPALVSPAVSTAMSYFVAASTFSATSQLARGSIRQQRFQPTDWTTQVGVASAESWRCADQARRGGLDPDYLAWNEGFGRGVATAADATGANDAIRLGGLQVQWYGNVQGHLLLALAGAQPAAGQ